MDPYATENENPVSGDDEYMLGPNDLEPVVIKPVYFIALHIATLGLYSVWWNYKCWKYFKDKEGSDILPALRAVFFLFFGIDFFNKIGDYCKEYDHKVNYNSIFLWGSAIAINLLAYLPIPYRFLGLFCFVSFLPAVKELNFYFTGNKNGYVNDKLNDRQVLLLVLGSIYWMLIIWSLFIGDPAAGKP